MLRAPPLWARVSSQIKKKFKFKFFKNGGKMAISKRRHCWRTTPCRKLPTLLLCPLTPTWWTWGRASSAKIVVIPAKDFRVHKVPGDVLPGPRATRMTTRSLHEDDSTSESRPCDLMDMGKGILGSSRLHSRPYFQDPFGLVSGGCWRALRCPPLLLSR